MVLSSWRSRCESSPGSLSECVEQRQAGADPQTKPCDRLVGCSTVYTPVASLINSFYCLTEVS